MLAGMHCKVKPNSYGHEDRFDKSNEMVSLDTIIVHRQGIGEILSQGIIAASKHLRLEDMAVHIKSTFLLRYGNYLLPGHPHCRCGRVYLYHRFAGAPLVGHVIQFITRKVQSCDLKLKRQLREIQIRDKVGGSVTVISVGDDTSE